MLYYKTIHPFLHNSLLQIMEAKEFNIFRLVGGTSLSLQIGHRESIYIDLFSDADYGTIDFKRISSCLESTFPYVKYSRIDPAIGRSYLIGDSAEKAIKLDIYYTDSFIDPPLVKDNIRMATIEEIIAMKLDVIQGGGRKKDFWDLHELFYSYSLEQMLNLHEKRYPYSHEKQLILQNLTDFTLADNDFDPICLLGKYWEFIKKDFKIIVQTYNHNFKR